MPMFFFGILTEGSSDLSAVGMEEEVGSPQKMQPLMCS